MEEELYRQCSDEDPTECEIDELIDLLNDEDCPHLITVQHTYHTFFVLEHYTPLELLAL